MLAALASLLPAGALAEQASLYRKQEPVTLVLQLPKACWSRYMKDMQSAEYQIPPGCGPTMNHYCDGALAWIRVRESAQRGNLPSMKALQQARRLAAENVERIRPYPACPLRQHAETTLLAVDLMIQTRGGGPAKAGR